MTATDRIVVGWTLITLAFLGEAQGWPGMWLVRALGWVMLLRELVAPVSLRWRARRGDR